MPRTNTASKARLVEPEPEEVKRYRYWFRGELGYFDGGTLELCLQLMTLQARVGETVETEIDGMPRKLYYIIEDKNRSQTGYRWVSSTPPVKGSSNPNTLGASAATHPNNLNPPKKEFKITVKRPTTPKPVGSVVTCFYCGGTDHVDNPCPGRGESVIARPKPVFTKVVPVGAVKSMQEVIDARKNGAANQTTRLTAKTEPIASDVSVLLSSLHGMLHSASCLADLLDRQAVGSRGNEHMIHGADLSAVSEHAGLALKHVNAIRTKLREDGDG